MKALSIMALIALPLFAFAGQGYSVEVKSASYVGSTATTTPAVMTGSVQVETKPARAPSDVTNSDDSEEASADMFLEIKGVEGEAEEKKGNVEYGWKVEEGEKSAASDMYLKIKGIDGETERSGVRVAVGDVNGDGKAEVTHGEVNAVLVRGWDPEKKKEILDAAPKSDTEIDTEEDLALFIAATANADAMMEEVAFNYEKIQVKYNSEGKLLGFIPLGIVISAEAHLDSETGEPRVSVKFPWYSFLVVKSVTEADIIQGFDEETAQKDKGHKNEIEILSYSFGLQEMGSVFNTLSNVLKTKHDTAKNSIGNIR